MTRRVFEDSFRSSCFGMRLGARLRLAGGGVPGWISASARASRSSPVFPEADPRTPPPGMRRMKLRLPCSYRSASDLFALPRCAFPPKCVPKPELGNEGASNGSYQIPAASRSRGRLAPLPGQCRDASFHGKDGTGASSFVILVSSFPPTPQWWVAQSCKALFHNPSGPARARPTPRISPPAPGSNCARFPCA
jgi:hypothetical protein